MKRLVWGGLLVLAAVSFIGYSAWAAEAEIKKDDFVTICKAGDGCGKFEMATSDPKDCKCGAMNDKLHVLKVEGDVVVLCQCGGGCSCELNIKNPYLCGCGSPVKVVRIFK
ncbi:MAG: hypothetical protein FIB02_03990 [Desulfuromonas sp.]|nr:hypothetical protein [Desulfuromonas sp.]